MYYCVTQTAQVAADYLSQAIYFFAVDPIHLDNCVNDGVYIQFTTLVRVAYN